jgi:chromosome segregation ATPase
MKKMTLANRSYMAAAGALVMSFGAGAAHAQTASMEDRLRAELRSEAQQLQALQTQQAQLTAAKTSAESERDAALADAKKLREALAQSSGQTAALAQQQEKIESAARGQVAAVDTQLGKYKQAYDDLLKLARGKEAARAAIQTTVTQRDAQIAMCTAQNKKMYAAGREILTAYESMSSGELFKIRQPFSQGARVEFENKAQSYGDKLYSSQFDPRQPVPGPAKAAATPAPTAK